jgi:hypothetical protein
VKEAVDFNELVLLEPSLTGAAKEKEFTMKRSANSNIYRRCLGMKMR